MATEMEADLEREKKTTFAVTADMARQYKALQEDLIHKINSLETTLTEQREELDLAQHELTELIKEKDEEMAYRDETIAQLKKRIEEMSAEFVDMLKSTTTLMKEHLATIDDSEDGDKNNNYLDKMKENNPAIW
uniref:Dynein regulatory complex protein 12 n=1 Tax=Oxyrrhis marina TaxID=2969 RepID=A0A6U9LQT0_OXYMA